MARQHPPWSDAALAAAVHKVDGDRDTMRALTAAVEDAERHLQRAREARLEHARVMRAGGWALVTIARYAQVSDSYLARKLGSRRPRKPA